MKSLNIKSRTIIALCLFAVLFVSLVLVATYCDFQVSKILTKNALKPGEYLANDLFGVVGEVVGTSPIYILLSICTVILCWYFAKCFDKKKWAIALAVIFALAGTVAWWFYIKDIMKYVIEHAANEIGAAGSAVYEYRHNGAVIASQVLVALTIQALTVLALRPLKAETLKRLVWWVVAALAACVLANIIILIVKDPVGRMRFRAINSNVGQRLINAGLVQGYTPWYVRNGQPDEAIINSFIDAYPGASDAFKSFPSGHTCAAGMSYALIMLPDVVDFKHKKAGKIACWVTPVVITMLVAISRIVVGAHYMSDVTFGGTIAFVSFILMREIFVCRGSHFFALFPCLAPKKAVTLPIDIEVENAVETEDKDTLDILTDESVEETEIENGTECSDDKNEEIALCSEQANEIGKEIADNLKDGVVVE
ncbi:MAG TPA: hypothetical protein DD626_05450 [Clostridiales bacterium]|nr:hypothetical protein [Clostridiales bacterium]